ncbi:MAG: 30S ribosomal protein S5 [Thaumarchaeota archaeon]|nr:MAG: 30S ribosomal protein S5 [Nitrososphaerota archaeon]
MSSSYTRHRSRQRTPEKQESWIPRTRLGKRVSEGEITSLDEIFQQGWKIREPEIVKTLLPDVSSEVVNVGIVQKQTDAGRLTRFRAVVAVGNGDGWFGVGEGKAAQRTAAIDKATIVALPTIIPVKRGCGSPECTDKTNHSVPFRTVGKAGGVTVELVPAPKGVGLVAGPALKKLLALAGLKDVYVRTFGSTGTPSSLANAVYDAFYKSHQLNV